MYGIVALVAVALVSLLITRVASTALTATGMSRTAARFQARSALSGVGFTTSEAESVVNHPVRRRIIMALMLTGTVGVATVVASLIGSLLRTDNAEGAVTRGLLLVAGLLAVYLLSKSAVVDRWLSNAIARVLSRYTDIEVRDYEALLHVAGEYTVKELLAKPQSWLAGRTLGELRLRDEGITVLGIVRGDQEYVGVPGKETIVGEGDSVILYGRASEIRELSKRSPGPRGQREHVRSAWDQSTVRPDP